MGVITVFNVACYGAAFIGGLALLAAPFTRSGRAGPHWTRVALWICGPVATGWGALGLALVFTWQSLPRNTYDLILHFKTLFAGMGVGILVLLFASGDFLPVFFRRRAKSP